MRRLLCAAAFEFVTERKFFLLKFRKICIQTGNCAILYAYGFPLIFHEEGYVL